MAKACRGNASNVANNGGNVTVNLTSIAGVAAGDLVVLIGGVPTAAAGTPGVPAGYVQVSGSPKAVGGAGAGRLYVAVKQLTGADASVVFTGDGDANSSVGAQAFVFSGAEYDSSVTPTTANGDSTNPNPPAITPDENATGVFFAAMSRAVDNTPGNPANYVNQLRSPSSGDTNDIQLCSGWRDGRSSGVSEDPPAFSSWDTGQWAAITFCIKDAAVVDVIGPLLSDRRNRLVGGGLVV